MAILEVRLPLSVSGGPQQETRFLVQWSCDCCRGRRDWITRTQLSLTSNFPEQRIRHLEESIRREQRERETKLNAEELMKFLDFDDIQDFTQLSTQDFEEKNFISKDAATDNVYPNESYCHMEELKQEESIQSLLQGLTDKSSNKINNEATLDGTVIQCQKLSSIPLMRLEPMERTDFEECKNS